MFIERQRESKKERREKVEGGVSEVEESLKV